MRINIMNIVKYVSRRNPNKYLEIKHYKDGHYTCRAYMEWSNGVRNYIGNHGEFYRLSIKWARENLLDAYKVYEA